MTGEIPERRARVTNDRERAPLFGGARVDTGLGDGADAAPLLYVNLFTRDTY